MMYGETEMRRLITYLKNIIKNVISFFLKGVKSLICAKYNWLKIVYSISYKKMAAFYIMLFVFGRILLYFSPIRFDFVHQILLTIISMMSIFSLKYAYVMTNNLKDASSGLIYGNRDNNCTSRTIKMIVDEMIDMQQSVWWPLIMFLPPIGFIRKNIYLGFIPQNPAGYYAVGFGASAYYIALLGYTQIAIALFQFYKISHDMGNCIPLDFPSDAISPPKWLSLWNQLFQKIIKIFFCLGTLFTLEYVLLMPENVVTIKNGKFIFNVCDSKSFLVSWGTIFVFIIIAFPLISIVIKSMEKLLIKNLSAKITNEYKILFSNNLTQNSALNLWAYKQLINNSIQYNSYFHLTKSIIPLASTLISLLVNIIKLYESILHPLLGI